MKRILSLVLAALLLIGALSVAFAEEKEYALCRQFLKPLEDAGVKMAVCSATAIPLVEMTLERLGLRKYFSFLTSCDEVRRGKTEPDVFELAISRFGAKPADCVMYEDSNFGIRTAGKIGMKVAAVYDPSCQEPPAVIRELSDSYIETFVGLDLTPRKRSE